MGSKSRIAKDIVSIIQKRIEEYKIKTYIEPFVGGAWTNAILGIAANKIHICMAPEAENLICRLIEMCIGDSPV